MSLQKAVYMLDELIDHFRLKESSHNRLHTYSKSPSSPSSVIVTTGLLDQRNTSYCYCKSQLISEQSPDDIKIICVNCCSLFNGEEHVCLNRSCYYAYITKKEYAICTDCHQLKSTIDTDDDAYTFILNKFNHSLQTIS